MSPHLRLALTFALLAFAIGWVGLWLAPQEPAWDFQRLDEAIEGMVEEHHLDGAAVVIVRGQERIHERAFGSFTLDTDVTAGSASKWASAAAILSLVDDGVLALDQPVSELLPAFQTDSHRAITLRQALSHQTGLPPKHRCLRNYQIPLRDCVDQLTEMPLVFPPPEGFSYGSLSYHVAAAMAEQATGQPWREIFQSRISRPLGMDRTRFGRFGVSPNPGVAGNLSTSADDFATFMQAMLGYGRVGDVRILSEASVREMERPQSGAGPRFHHIPDRHLLSTHHVYGLGMWRDVVTPDEEPLVLSSPGKFGFTPWIDRRVGVAGVLVASFRPRQLLRARPPDPANVIYLVCDIVDRMLHDPDAPSPNPSCHRRGVDADFKLTGRR